MDKSCCVQHYFSWNENRTDGINFIFLFGWADLVAGVWCVEANYKIIIIKK